MSSWFRFGSFAAAPDQHVIRPWITTSMFPRLPRRSRSGYRAGVLALVALLVLFVLLHWQPPLVAISAVGLPLLFLLYLRQTATGNGMSVGAIAAVAVSATAIGVGWTFGLRTIWSYTYDDVLGTAMTPSEQLINLVLIPIGDIVLMLAPAAVMRLWRPGVGKSLDGFAIGAVSALFFTGAVTVTQQASVFSNGLVAKDTPLDALFATAAVRGIAAPLTAVAVGGAVGAALWFRRRAMLSPSVPYLAFALTMAILAYIGQNAIDYVWLTYAQIAGLYAAIAVAAVLVARIVVHCTVAGEADEDTDPDRTASAVRHTSSVRLLAMLGTGLVIVVAATVGLSLWLTPPPANYTCPPDCGRPPLGQPVTTNPEFTSADGEFTVSYPPQGSAYQVTQQPDGVVLDLHAGDGGTLHLFGQPAAGRTPRQIADAVLADAFPNATTDYEIPNAQVGYQLGYGVIADVYKAGTTGDPVRLRVLVMVAVKNDYALIAAAGGPYHEFSPSYGSGHPSGANFMLAMDMAKYINSFSWRGDAPR